jgi:hypothetical protein
LLIGVPVRRPEYRTNRRFSIAVRIGRNIEVRPVGGAAGCLAMIAFSIVVSVVLTLVLNLLLR